MFYVVEFVEENYYLPRELPYFIPKFIPIRKNAFACSSRKGAPFYLIGKLMPRQNEIKRHSRVRRLS